MPFDIFNGKTCSLGYHLDQDRADALADAGCRRVNVYPVVFDDQTAAAIVGQADADAGILQGTGNANIRPAVIVRLFDGIQRFGQACRRVGNLAIGQDVTGPDGIAISDFPRVDADQFSQFI